MMRSFNFLLLLLAFAMGCKQKTTTTTNAVRVKTGDYKKGTLLRIQYTIPVRFVTNRRACCPRY